MPDDEVARPNEEEVGAWSNIKLSVVSRYIGYRNEQNSGGGFLNATVRSPGRYYIDGHASYGEDRVQGVFRRNGTPLIALEAVVQTRLHGLSRFTHLWFVELRADRAAMLRKHVEDRNETARADVLEGDINERILDILPQVPHHSPALCVLDPYDPDDLHFSTIALVAAHGMGVRQRKIELFVNLPIGLQHRQGRVRGGTAIRPSVVRNLTRLLGNDRWLPQLEAWGREELPWADAYIAMKRSFQEELRGLGYRHLWEMDVPAVNPMYALVFASDHPAALSIMKSAMKNWERDPANPQGTLGL